MQHLHRKSKRVIGVAECVNTRLARVCDEFVCKPQPTTTDIVDTVIDVLLSREEGTMPLADLGHALKQRDSSLIPRNYGFASLTGVIESEPQKLRFVSGYKTSKCVVGVVT